MSAILAEISGLQAGNGLVLIRAKSGAESIDIELSPQDVLSLVSGLISARAEALKQVGEPVPATPVPVHQLVIGRDQAGVEFLRLYVTPRVYHDYKIPPIGQPAEALKNWTARLSGTGSARS